MRSPSALRFALALAALAAPAVLAAAVGCGSGGVTDYWECLNPETGRLDPSIGDWGHLGPNGQSDPCHCYDPCGESAECPIVVDAGPLPPGCNADAGDDGP